MFGEGYKDYTMRSKLLLLIKDKMHIMRQKTSGKYVALWMDNKLNIRNKIDANY